MRVASASRLMAGELPLARGLDRLMLAAPGVVSRTLAARSSFGYDALANLRGKVVSATAIPVQPTEDYRARTPSGLPSDVLPLFWWPALALSRPTIFTPFCDAAC